MKRNLWAAFVWVALIGWAQAGVVIEMEKLDPRTNQSEGIQRIFAQGEMLAIEENGKVDTIFLGDRMILINHKDKSYTEIDQATMDQLGGQMNDSMKKMKEQMEKLPPEQRAMMERMMKGRMPAMKPLELRVEPGENGSVGDYSCRMYTVYLNDEKSQELCAAPVSQLGAAAEAWGAFQAMARFSKKMMESFSQGPLGEMISGNAFQVMEDINGFPVLSRTFRNGAAVEESRFKSSESQSISDDTFQPPQGYRRREMMKTIRGR